MSYYLLSCGYYVSYPIEREHKTITSIHYSLMDCCPIHVLPFFDGITPIKGVVYTIVIAILYIMVLTIMCCVVKWYIVGNKTTLSHFNAHKIK